MTPGAQHPDGPAAQPLRSDAERNRERIIAAARTVFARDGLNASMASVAREAGVGIATMFRRFPTKEELVDAVFSDRMGAYVDVVTAALDDPDPWNGFVGYIETACAMQAADSGFADVLTTTGRLIEGADRRLRETGRWVSTVMLPGSLRPGADGYVATVQVRMLHAHMRHLARTRGFDESAYGAPINQVDLARTWMDFTLTSLLAEEKMGLGLSSTETASIYRYWWAIAHLLGIDSELVEGIQSNEQAQRIDDMLQAVTGPLSPQSAELAAATLSSISDLLHEALNVPQSLGAIGLHSLARRFHPDAIADELGIRHSSVADRALDTAISRIRSYRAKLRRDPDRWTTEQQKQIEATRQLLGDGTDPLYETHRAG